MNFALEEVKAVQLIKAPQTAVEPSKIARTAQDSQQASKIQSTRPKTELPTLPPPTREGNSL